MTCACTTKDPDAWRWYGIDWTDFLTAIDPGVTIVSSEWLSSDTAITIAGSSVKPGNLETAVYLKDGTLGSVYQITNRVAISNGGREDYTIEVTIVED